MHSILDMEGAKAVIIKDSDMLFYTYINLQDTFLKKGQRLFDGTYIGNIKTDDGGQKQLVFMITDRKGYNFFDDVIVDRLKRLPKDQ